MSDGMRYARAHNTRSLCLCLSASPSCVNWLCPAVSRLRLYLSLCCSVSFLREAHAGANQLALFPVQHPVSGAEAPSAQEDAGGPRAQARAGDRRRAGARAGPRGRATAGDARARPGTRACPGTRGCAHAGTRSCIHAGTAGPRAARRRPKRDGGAAPRREEGAVRHGAVAE
jgi:hypothetical protein